MRRLLLVAALAPCFCSATVRYQIRPDISKGEFDVSVRLDNPNPSETFKIPGWSPGFYVMQKYEAKISGVRAVDEAGKPLLMTHPDPETWLVSSVSGHPLLMEYRVKGNDVGLGFFGASIAQNEAYTNGAASFMYVLGRRDEPTTVQIQTPEGWSLATAMDPAGKNLYQAQDYDEMIDDPIQMGKFVERDFKVRGVPFEAVFQAPADEKIHWNIDEQTEVLKKISEPALKLFGTAPFKRYIYFFHLTPAGFQGGLEHRSGTVIAVPNMEDPDLSDLVAHEYFHAWNVKQIRPVLLGPFDYTSPQRTGNLWFAEGVTDYYSKILTYRSGVHDLTWLLDELGDQVNTYQGGRTRLTNTVEDASREVWEHGGFNLGDLDYYNKGLLAGLIFDAKIREVTGGKKSLDDVMRLMFDRYRLPHPGYSEDGIKNSINEVAGVDLSPLYDSVIRSTAELPYDDLRAIGLSVSKPGSDIPLALGGYPLPTTNVTSEDLKKFGIRQTDRFVSFGIPPADNEASINLERGSTATAISVPLVARRFPSYQLIVNPTPVQSQVDLFREWTQR